MAYYRHHLFFCTNQRTDGRACCADKDSARLRDYCKKQVKERGLAGPGKVRVNTAGCMDRCELGPVLAVYPEGVWYSYVDEQDLDEIIREHLENDRPVARLRLSGEPAKSPKDLPKTP